MIKFPCSDVKSQILKEFFVVFSGNDYSQKLSASVKSDNSPVTYLDLIISKIIKKSFKKYNFLSEEDAIKNKILVFPLIVLDPIDGTRELMSGIPECCISLAALISSDISNPQSWGWLFNPFTAFETSSGLEFCSPQNFFQRPLCGLVSRTEWGDGLFNRYLKDKNIKIFPRGSIAYKLGLLSVGAVDFVISLRPKNIWDIAGGTLICNQRNINFFERGELVTKLNRFKFIPPLIWCRKEIFHQLFRRFS